MALIGMCFYCTEENGKLKYAKQCLQSLVDTVDLYKHFVIIVNQASSEQATDWINDFVKPYSRISISHLNANIGTAKGINIALGVRGLNEVFIKCDDDVQWHQSGWADQLEDTLARHPEIGILGLKRDDVYGNFIEEGVLLYGDDIMGTCTALSPALLDKIGYFNQPSNYGFDDTILSARSIAAGFKNAYLHNIKITHLDEGGTSYTDWKKREASIYLQEVSHYIDMIKNGKISYYYDGND